MGLGTLGQGRSAPLEGGSLCRELSPGALLAAQAYVPTAAGQCCALAVMRTDARSLERSPCLPVSSLSLTQPPAQPVLFSVFLFSFSAHLYWSGVSRPIKYINEFLAPALCTQVTHALGVL